MINVGQLLSQENEDNIYELFKNSHYLSNIIPNPKLNKDIKVIQQEFYIKAI